MGEIRVEDAMTKKIIKVGPGETAINIAKKMKERDIGSMLVCDGGKLLGLITSEDLVKRVIIPNKDPKKLTAKEIMTKKLITTTPDEELVDAINTMIENGIQRLPVLDGKKLVGILTDGDVLRIAPHLVESLVEAKREMDMEMEGDVCEICGNYSENLRRVNGQWICEECYEASPEI